MRRKKKGENRTYNNKHKFIQIMLSNRILLYYYILSLNLYNAIG